MLGTLARDRKLALGWVALLVVYVVWGSTFTGIQVAIRAVPPLLMAGTRYLLAGLLLYAVVGRAGGLRWSRPSFTDLRTSAVVGLLLLLGGNGLVSWSELAVPSGIAALVIATVPLWMAVLGAAWGRFPSPGRLGWAGVLIGLLGVAVLADPTTGHLEVTALVGLLAAAILWALGSLYARAAPSPASVLQASALEMIIGGVGLIVAGLATSEAGHVHWGALLGGPMVAYAWLVLGGSILGYSCYVYALEVLPTSTVATYAYVNPVVALLLGFFILGQGLSTGSALAVALVLVGVVLMVSGSAVARRRRDRPWQGEPGG